MKKIGLILLLFVFKSYSQNTEITIQLKDIDNNNPVEDVSVFVSKTQKNYISNAQGIVTFLLVGNSSIKISNSNYNPVTIKSNTLKDKINIILLKKISNELEEIIFTRIHPQEILKSIVENSIKKLTVPVRLKVYEREFFKLNNDYSFFNDGLINFQITGKPNSFETTIFVEQNRSYGLIDTEIKDDLLGYNLNNIMENYYVFKYLNPLIESRSQKEYDFIIKANPANKDYYTMTVTPMENAKGLRDDFTIIYDKKKKMIIEVSSFISPATLAKMKDKNAEGAKNIYKSVFKTIYKIDGDDYFLISSKEEIGYERIDKKKTTQIEVRNYFVITDFSEQKFSFKDSDVFKDKALFNKKNVILTDYWNVSGLTATDDEQEIIDKLELEN
jgi:hypothetical protein